MASLSDLHLLVVDDNAQMRQLVRALLRAGGIHRVSEAETAPDAMTLMRTHPIDLVLLDWKMAPIDGLAFTRSVRWDTRSPNPYIPILMLTAHTEASRVAAARDAGVTGFVKKPISARLLFERLTSALTDTRMFVRSDDFFGPDRRHGLAPGYDGPWRRSNDQPGGDAGETFDLDEMRFRA